MRGEVGDGWSFAKMHGLGNDFVVVDGVSRIVPKFEADAVAVLADRRRGIGFDQLLLLQAPNSSEGDFCYRIFNADGGEVGQCGNGVRCAHVFARRRGLSRKNNLTMDTLSTRIVTADAADGGGVRACMPAPVFLPRQKGAGYCFDYVTVGNPHYVCLAGEVDRETLRRVGEELNECVPGGINVGFGEVRGGVIALQVYERGAGLTAACGSGALAAAAVGIRAGMCDDPVRVTMPGGSLLCGTTATGGVFLEGEVAHVFDGWVPL